jgi:hypothetical protein
MTTEIMLTNTAKEAVDEAIAAALGDAYDCTRAWSAWSYGTMGPDDFSLVAEDSDRLREITDAAVQAVLQSPEIQALRKDAERYRHLRDFMRTGPRDVFGVWWLSEQGYPTTLDEALDISIKEES